MTADGHLQVYDLILKTRSPLFIGSGYVKKENEYIFDARSGAVRMISMESLFSKLIEKGLVDDYEKFVLSGNKSLYDFLKNCRFSEGEISAMCLYRIDAADALDGEHSLKEIHTFVRNTEGKVYVPGSSVKGALRTAILSAMMEKEQKGKWPDARNKGVKAKQMQELEGEYLNTLELKKDKKTGARLNDAVNSIMRGIALSDSLPLPESCIALVGKTDALPTGEMRKLPLCRECVKPDSLIHMKLTIDASVLGNDFNAETLKADIRRFDSFYSEVIVSAFTKPTNCASLSYSDCLIFGGGSGFFVKSLAYQYLGFDDALDYVAGEMQAQFRQHKHDKDISVHGISPHTLKYGKYNGKLYPYGICEVAFI